MKISDPRMMLSNYEAIYEAPVDASGKVTPIVREGRTLRPISALIGALGGTANWDNTERKVTIQLNGNTVDVWIDKKNAVVNGIANELEVSPTILNGRTMLPLRFVTENLGLEVLWDNENRIIAVYQPWFKRELIMDADIYSEFFPLLISEDVIPEKVAPISSKPITGYVEGYYPLETDGFKAQVPEAWTFMYSEVKYKTNPSDMYSIDTKATPTEEEYEFNPISEYMTSHGIYSKMRIVPYDQNIHHTDFLKRVIFNFKPNEFSPVSVSSSDYALMNKSYSDSIYDRSSWDLIVFKNDVCYILTSGHEINSAGIWPAEVHRSNIKNFRAQLEILYGSFEITNPNIVFTEVVKNYLPVSN
ncbi:copper amine oxidase N-terminal domain-containing protein [Paenibacillus paeoniae]|nr:copper amine oxidase N-terminal domain-containing protein [Paenibacillus paeoniae]